MKLEYKPGAANVVVDSLSRVPVSSDTAVEEAGSDVYRVLQTDLPKLTIQNMQMDRQVSTREPSGSQDSVKLNLQRILCCGWSPLL